MAKLIGIIAGLAVFGGWMNIVGNPHVVETTMGLVIGFVVGYLAYKESSKFAAKFDKT